MKIGLITLFRDNYGSELQCYATKTFLNKKGFDCDLLFIEEYGYEKIKSKVKSVLKILFYSLRYKGFWQNRKQINSSIRKNSSSMTSESKFWLQWFCESVLQPKGVEYRLVKEKEFNNKYDFFITGSDQVWGGGYLVHPFMFLEFAEDKKKIALSPSFGVEKIKKFNIKFFKKEISKIPVLSAREESGVKIIRKLTSKQVQRLSDPVMLLTQDEWSVFSEKGYQIEGEYIFVHFLGTPNPIALKVISHLSEKFNFKVVCFANDYAEYNALKKRELKSGNPYDYVSLIKNASFVCTDSFHTSHFAIIFDVKFFTFDRTYGHKNKQSSRLQNLFTVFECRNRYITEDSFDINKLDFTKPSFDILRKNEYKSISEYLLNVINSDFQTREDKFQLKKQDDCTGCMACFAICPKDAISYAYSDFGYRIPSVDATKCVNCTLCYKVCNALFKRSLLIDGEAYIAYNTDSYQRKISASAGVFSCLANAFLESGGIVVGSCMSFDNGTPDISHVVINKKERLKSLLGSKYVESNCADIYKPISKSLKSLKKVLFCGTSCQVKALYSYLNEKNVSTENLYTIDLICHGVPGYKYFSEYVGLIQSSNNCVIDNLTFRSKQSGNIRFQISGDLISDTNFKSIIIPIEKSSYYDMFIHQDNYRDCCYHCEYTSTNKPGDITIGDYFEAKKDYPELFQNGAVLEDSDYLNCLLINSEKGRKLLSEFGEKLFIYPVQRERVQLSHSNLCKPSSYTHIRLKMRKTYEKHGIRGIERKYKNVFRIKKILRSTKTSLNAVIKMKRR